MVEQKSPTQARVMVWADRLEVDKIYVDKIYVDKIYVDKIYVDKIYVDKIYVDKIYVARAFRVNSVPNQTGDYSALSVFSDLLGNLTIARLPALGFAIVPNARTNTAPVREL